MPLRLLSALVPLCVLCVAPFSAFAQFANFEAQQTRPICLSQDGTRLFAVNTADGRVSVFDVSNPANAAPVLIREIPVGVDPVSVNALSNDEAWVVNEVGDSVSVVSVPLGVTTDTLAAKDEPGHVVFAGTQAFVSCSRNNLIRVFDTATHAPTGTIALQGLNPHSLAVSNDGTKVYAAFKLSGNKTTLLPPDLAPPQPPPTNGALPPPPQVGLIVASNDSRLSPQPNMPDNDVAEINAATRTVARYFKGVGTINFAVAARPGSSELWVANTEARNLVRFEPVLRAHLVDNRVTRIHTGTSAVTPFDLNPGLNYALLPNPVAQATALAQPTDIAFEPDGAHFWVASFGTDRVARVNANTGAVVARVETGPTTGSAADPRNKRGPRGLAYQAGTGRLYALNRISNTITVVESGAIAVEIPVGSFDPTPVAIRQGRGFLYDARLSGNGTQSCATCHIDGDRDDLAWDLGDPGGSMQQVVQQNPPPLPPVQTFTFHPMKGPMTTQTLRGITGTEPLHWRADRANFNSFNGAFDSLLGGSMLSTADMNAFRDFINTVLFEPNPNQNLDRTLPASFAGGNPTTGQTTYLNTQYQTLLTCNTCHTLPTGTNRLIIPAAALQESQDFKVPQLRNMYQKLNFIKSSTIPSLSGFGLVHDGMDPDLLTFLSRPVFNTFAAQTPAGATIRANLNAFVQCLDTGTAPAVGYARTSSTVAAISSDWTTLQAQAVAGNSDLVIHGILDGKRHALRFRPATNDYASDQTGLGPFTRAQLEAKITAGTAMLTLTGVPIGTAPRSTDRNGNGIPDASEPLPELALSFPGGDPQLAWSAAQPALVLEYTDALASPDWRPVLEPRAAVGPSVLVPDPAAGTQRYYRLRVP